MNLRQTQQLKKWRKLVRDLKQSVSKSYINCANRDSYYKQADFKEEVIISN